MKEQNILGIINGQGNYKEIYIHISIHYYNFWKPDSIGAWNSSGTVIVVV